MVVWSDGFGDRHSSVSGINGICAHLSLCRRTGCFRLRTKILGTSIQLANPVSDWQGLTAAAASITEWCLRDASIAVNQEEVTTQKEWLLQNVIRVCKHDLEGIGLEMTIMHRLRVVYGSFANSSTGYFNVSRGTQNQ